MKNIEIFVAGFNDSITLDNVREIIDRKDGAPDVVFSGDDMKKIAIYPDHSYTIVSTNTVYVFSGAHLQFLEL